MDQVTPQTSVAVVATDAAADGPANVVCVGPDLTGGAILDALQTTALGSPRVVRAVSVGSLPPAQVVRRRSGSGVAPVHPVRLHGQIPVEQLERQLLEVTAALRQEQERGAALVSDRDQRLGRQGRLVEDLRGAIDGQRREVEDLRQQQAELLLTNQEQARRLADLEALLHDMYRDAGHRQQEHRKHHPAPEHQHDAGHDEADGRHALVLRPPAPPHENHELLGGDRIDLSLQEFFDMHPDFDIGLSKHGPGWYTFERPINKKVHMKMVGDNVLVRAGGGFVELHQWLEQYWHRAQAKDA